ncbi:helix-turn-helix transcriptional regulator [Nocardioides jishulii]|uniref:WYL domain-containing protein n=1 Tax=Nocardioides jishulii TaxID=2575440 RepID=A0A4U2YN06_9ACTN|nr:WYL domain-containing protein [Nocardioides jishulii]QCX27553.1 WYL domain-containing protein [Nocardioides jishulii]TKI62360.1 WYL domain-containing protein [Nocardioides jishulii]
MSARRSERLLNLLIMLLVQRRYVPKERIRELLYPDQSVDAFDRMFDRDKEELRALGVPIEVGSLSAFHEDELGYRIRPDDLALPEISLTAEEASVLTLAGKVWHHANLADTTAAALRKLMPALPSEEAEPPPLARPVIEAEEPSFDDFWDAIQDRRTVSFDYRKTGVAEASPRRVEPWGLFRQSGRWYVVGRDTEVDEERVFRLSRVVGRCRVGKTVDAYRVPADLDLREVADRFRPHDEATEARVLLRPGSGHGLRRQGKVVAAGVIGPDGSDAWERLLVRGSVRALADEVLMVGPRAYVESPEALRDDVRGRLAALVNDVANDGVTNDGGKR